MGLKLQSFPLCRPVFQARLKSDQNGIEMDTSFPKPEHCIPDVLKSDQNGIEIWRVTALESTGRYVKIRPKWD